MTTNQADHVLSKLKNVKEMNGGWQALCPAHDDRNPSLSVSLGNNGAVVLHCHAGCECQDVLKALELTFADLSPNGKRPKKRRSIEATYNYTDENEKLLYQVVRWGPKGFSQRRPDNATGGWEWSVKGVKRVLYRLPELAASDPSQWVFICEGEKSADAIADLGLVATTNAGGAGKWRYDEKNYAESLTGRKVAILPDNDPQGAGHANDVRWRLRAVAASVRIVELPGLAEKGDPYDWAAGGGTATELLELVDSTPDATGGPDSFVLSKVAPAEPADPDPSVLGTESPDGESYDDAGNARCFIKLYGDVFRYCDAFGWLHYDGKRWITELAEAELGKAIFATLRARQAELLAEIAEAEDDEERKKLLSLSRLVSESRRNKNGAKDALKSFLAVSASQFDRDTWLFNCNNGTLDLRTGELRPHDPDDYITKNAPVDYDPKALCPKWSAFLGQIFPNDRELWDFIARAIGYTLTGSQKEQCLFFAYGLGANGKSTFLETIAELMGGYGQRTVTETLMMKDRVSSGPRPYIARLKGVRLVVAAEVDKGRRLAESLIKDLTGGDTLTGDFKYQNPFDFCPTHTLWMSGNHKPEIQGTDNAIWRRIRLIPFLQTFEGDTADQNLRDKLKDELPGILAWAVRGCMKWKENGLPVPDAVTEATGQYRQEQDELALFIAECCTVSDTSIMTFKTAYDTYESWGGRLKKGQFSFELRARGFKRKAGHSNYPTFYGIGLALGA